MRSTWVRRGAAAVVLVAMAALGAPDLGLAQDPPPVDPPTTSPSPTIEPTLTSNLDGVMSGLPETTCLAVSVDGRPLYRNRADRPLVPASNQKLLTAAVALDLLGEDHVFTTRVVATAAPVDGVVVGDLYVVGGGDPLLSTTTDLFMRRLDDAHHPTSFDALADRVAAAGITHVTGRVLGDESRYDTVRTVPSWPARYAEQGQSGPLSALSVDDGYHYELRPDDEPIRRRDTAPAASAAATFTGLLQARGIQIGAFPGEGTAPSGATEVASIGSAPLGDVVAQLLTFSDNQTGELLLKEVGRAAGGGGTTAAGAAAARDRGLELGLLGPEATVVDGSGLDTGNRVTCDDLIRILDAEGSDGTVADGLAVAARTGTLRRRLDTEALAGRLRAKTGNLREVTSLAGFVPTASGESATFAMITNGEPDPDVVWAAQGIVAELIAAHTVECRDPVVAPLVLPGGLYAGSMGTLAMFPLESTVLPGTVVPLQIFEARYKTLVDRCVADDEDFGIVLISRGSEVGGGDQRTDVGTRITIMQAQAAGSGRIHVLGAAVGRLRVLGWRPDDPHPWADVEDWPDPPPGPGFDARLDATEARLREVLALHRRLGLPGQDPDVLIDRRDPAEATWAIAHHTPVSAFDRQRLLVTPDLETRLDLVDELLGDERAVAEARLRGV